MIRISKILVPSLAFFLLAACSGQAQNAQGAPTPDTSATRVATAATPNATTANPTPTSTTITQLYTVRNGDTLSGISMRFDVSVDELLQANGLSDPNALHIGQVLKIPLQLTRVAPAVNLLPDSEVVYSPAYASFDVKSVANANGGYLATYQEKVEGEWLTGPQIVQLVAERYSVGPRVLLALLEFQSGWLTKTALTENQITYPMGLVDPIRHGLYFQTSWAANRLNEGYYGKLSGQISAFTFKDGSLVRVASTVNPGTAAIQDVLAASTTWDNWQNEIGASGFIATYHALFGSPNAIDPLIPNDLKQPPLRLPWNDGELWYLTGGPHSAWGDSSAWAAIDLTPSDVAGSGSCLPSRMWAIAAAPGKVLASEHGRVIESLSGSSFQGDGWALMYMHMAPSGRVAVGTELNVGDHVGHPSCEGGDAEASHVHFARSYNGQWIGPDVAPMVLSGWSVSTLDKQYDGTMVRGSESRDACNCREDSKNGITADGGVPNP